MYELKGIVKTVLPVQDISPKFSKQTLVVIDNSGRYAQEIPIEFTNDRIDLIKNVPTRAEVTVEFSVRGREWNGKYFANLEGYKIRVEGSQGESQPTQEPARSETAAAAQGDLSEEVDDDDIPF